ncbi:UNVERIFIED_CONTAM: protein NO VEIN, partial [Sesamum radiatum]
MYGQQPPFRSGGGGRGAAQPPQQQQIHLNPNFFPSPNLFLLQQNPNFLPHLNPFVQNLNSFAQLQQQFANSSFPVQLNSDNNNFQAPRPNGSTINSKYPQPVKVQNEMVEKLDKAVMRARADLLASDENVSAWKVSQAALLMVKAESWESLGVQIQQVPSLNRLLATEGKINAFIHCFVAVRRITSLYDLEVAICENEGIERFEELELGPLVRHPLAVHYFSVTSDVTEVCRIRTEDIISYLCEFIDSHKKKEVKVDTFLDFISKKQSISGWEKLCVRVQNFGVYVNHIKEARQLEDRVLEKCYQEMRVKSSKRNKNPPPFSAQKKEMDDHFTAISQRMKSFSSANTQFCGKHIRFISSSSEDDDSESHDYEDNRDEKNTDSNGNCSLSQLNVKDRVSSCPYPSATEEMTRLGLKSEVASSPCLSGGAVRCNGDNELPRGKRRYESVSSGSAVPHKLPKRDKVDADLKHKRQNNQGITGDSLSTESLKVFFTTWKEACQGNNAHEVLERMLQFYNTRKKRKAKEMFTSYPFVGLLYAAVTYMKYGVWDNLYDTFQASSQRGMDGKPFESSADCIGIDVELAEKDVVSAPKFLTNKHDVTAEDIAKKISEYFEDYILSNKNLSRGNRFCFLRKLCKCEYWLIEQYSTNMFESLGYGDYITFLEKYMHLLPHALQRCIIGDLSENVSLEAHLQPIELDVLLSQALNSLGGNETMNMLNISQLLARQFPLVCFKLVNSEHMPNFPDLLQEKRCSSASNSVLFSAPLLRLNYVGDMLAQDEQKVETSGFGRNMISREGIIAAVTTKDAIEVLLKAPMLTDLNLWSHWDILYAPSLGSMVEWLLKEVNTKELLCLVTKGGKVIRLDHSATLDSFLKVFIKGSSFETAVALLSLYALYGGEQNVPLSLLKCHARQAFEVIINNYLEMELHYDKNPYKHGKPSYDQHIVGKSASSNISCKLRNNRSILNKAATVMSRFTLDCLSYLPIEFCSFAADVLIAGLQSHVNDVPSVILAECTQIERVMLHEVGMSLGLMEWVHDYYSFCSSPTTGYSPGSSCLDVVNHESNKRSVIGQGEPCKDPSSSGEMLVSYGVDRDDLKVKRVSGGADSADGRVANSERLSVVDNHIDNDPAKVIESIRQEEFGLDQSLSATESRMLEKQHARLGRALHCLSQELYSQDSHFLLELDLINKIKCSNLQTRGRMNIINLSSWSMGIARLNQLLLQPRISALLKTRERRKQGNERNGEGRRKKSWMLTLARIKQFTPTNTAPSNEPVQNADDNIYPGDVEPTLIFILHEKGIVVLNNEQGFSANNIRALCDVGNSTKKGHKAGYIGKKGIGFKSVFRVTDAPEIHSNGFHIKFDITEGQIGFVLRRLSPCDIDLYTRLASADAGSMDQNYWKTCIMLPFRSNLSEGFAMNNILSMFMDLHPSLLLFLHRLRCIEFRNILDDSLIVMRKEVLGDGLVEVALGNEKMTWFVVSQKLKADIIRSDVQTTEISIAFTLQETGEGGYVPVLDQQPVFAFLPLRKGSPGKAITAFMSFIPLVGEVHGFFSSLPHNGLKSMGLSWLSSLLSTLYVMSSHSFMQTSPSFLTESDFIIDLQKTPFIPLSDGKYGSLDQGTVWLHTEVVGQGISDEYLLKAFPKLYSKLRIVSPNLLAAASSIEGSCSDTTIVENVIKMLYKVGVQRLAVHDIVKVHILPAISDDKNTVGKEELMTEYLAFAMFHLQSSCATCSVERGGLIVELRERALILTNYGYKRSNEVPIHFSREYGNPVDVNKLISGLDMKWHEIDSAYLKHPITKSMSGGVLKWRNFFQEIGVTDFVQVVQVDKSVPDISLVNSKDIVCNKDIMSGDSVVKNWESEELFHFLSWISSRDDVEKSKILVDILDRLWDDHFSNKVTGDCDDSSGEFKPFKSSFISNLQDFPWMVSSINNKLHYPKDLFHDCVAVNSVLGISAPYTVPKVKSEKLLANLGLKTQVTLDDALSVLRLWRRCEAPLRA